MNPFVAAGTESQNAEAGWRAAWPDLLAFLGGLAVAWFADWQTKDLVWSLWLSSLVVGYAMIIWMIFGPGLRALFGRPAGASPLPGAGLLLGGVFMLAFFTFHFGMFHFVHSIFLQAFFPVGNGAPMGVDPDPALYLTVVRDYWIFLPVAFLAERHAFQFPAAGGTVADLRHVVGKGGGMMKPYKNVVRLHLLIFFFAFAHFLKLENFLIYAVVYAVYFFPWRLVGRRSAASEAS